MEDYRLEQSGQEVQDILNGAAMQVDLNSEVERATEAENILDGKIDAEEERAKVAEKANADDIDAIEEKIPSGASSSNKLATASDVNDEAQARSDADQTINGKIDTIEAKIPTGASSENKLATEEYVDDSVATNTATFRGTYNLVSDLGLLPSATHEQIAYALGGEIATVDNSDYCFVQIPTSSETPTQIAKIERYKFNGDSWAFEYDLNNSGFTAAQWAAINSGITSGDVTKLSALPTNAELTTLLNGKQDTLTFDNTPTENSNNPVKSGGVYSGIKAEEERAKAAEKANADDIDAIEEKIPSGASSSNKLATASDISGLDSAIEAILLLIPSAATSLNQLADKAFVNSSIATNTATFRGTFNSVSDLHLSISATHEQIGTMLASSIATADNNDYAFVQIPTSAHRPTEIARTERYKFNGTTWEYEYDLNNSGYTTAQWAAINSTITQELVTKLSALPNNDDLTTALSVLTDSISAINAKIPSAASSDNKLVDNTAMQTYIAQLLDVLDATYNVTSTDGHVTVQITQTNGKVTAFAVTTRDIASAADLELIAGRVTTAEGNISTNAEDIAQLQAAYAALTQNDLVIIQPTDTWPVANPAENIIYRVVDRVNTPPEYYSDYMWNGTTMVLMAQYSNAIDPRPKKGSTNLVESGGVFDNMGALDVSELNATENPHTLATYADLSAAIAAIPSDYQKGGMSIKFVQSSDNKYVQYRLMSDTFNATVANWQGEDDIPTAGSENLVKSGGIFDVIEEMKGKLAYGYNNGYMLTSTGIYPNVTYKITSYIDISGISDDIKISHITASNAYNQYGLHFYNENKELISNLPGGSQDYSVVLNSSNIPSGTKYIRCCAFANVDIVTEIQSKDVLSSKVSVYPQQLTDEQKLQAADNIGLGTVNRDIICLSGKLPYNIINGYFLTTSGGYHPNADYSYVDYIDITGLSEIKIKGVISNVKYTVAGVQFFDANKNYISYLSGEQAAYNGTKLDENNIPSGTSYIRCTVNPSDFDIEIISPENIKHIANKTATYIPQTGISHIINVVKGNTLQIFHRSIIHDINYKNYQFILNTVSGKNKFRNRNRYDEYLCNNEDVDFVLRYNVCNNFGILTQTQDFTIHPISKASSPVSVKNILMIGDSFTDQQWYPNELYRRLCPNVVSLGGVTSPLSDELSNLNFVGTKNSNPYTEGISGWDYIDFMGSSSPFYINGSIDFSAYVASGNVHGTIQELSSGDKIDIAVIMLGTNRKNNEASIKGLWRALMTHNPNIKILVTGMIWSCSFGMGPAGGLAYYGTDWFGFNSNVLKYNSQLESYSLESEFSNNVTFVEVQALFDSEYNFPGLIRNVNLRNSEYQEKVGNDNVHPNKYGYYQIADAFYNAVHSIL